MKSLTRILIIEDNADDATLLERQLKKAHLLRQVRIIHDGGDALSYLTDEQIKNVDLSAIFLDLNLPTITGLQLLEAIRSHEATRDIPVIVMTSSNSTEDLEQCHKLGVSCFVSKPLTFSSFAKAFADTFHARRSVVYPGSGGV